LEIYPLFLLIFVSALFIPAFKNLGEDVIALAPLPDLFESSHSPFKKISRAKHTSVDILFTLSTGETIPSEVENTAFFDLSKYLRNYMANIKKI
jgi:hypothetical protein